jgi:site-specific DNA-methyltransferase (adenine-specific)
LCDPFVGSRTACLAAIKTGRHFIGIDIESEYVNIAEKRAKELLTQRRLSDS